MIYDDTHITSHNYLLYNYTNDYIKKAHIQKNPAIEQDFSINKRCSTVPPSPNLINTMLAVDFTKPPLLKPLFLFDLISWKLGF